MNTKLLHGSFNAGEISPELFNRPDIQQYQFGCARARNWITKPSGAAKLRPGFEVCSTLAAKARAVTFRADGGDIVITVEAGRFRFFRSGLPITVQGGTNDVFIIGDQEASGNVDLVNDVLYTTRPHDFADLEEIRLTSTGTEPGGTSSAFTYEARPQGPYGLQLKFSATDPVDITSYNSGTLFVWREDGLPDDYQAPIPLSSISSSDALLSRAAGASYTRVTLSSPHGWPQGTRFKWTGGTPPATRSLQQPYVSVTYDDREFRTTFAEASVSLTTSQLAAEQENPFNESNGAGFSVCPNSGGSFTPTVSAARMYPAGTVLFLRSAVGAFSANSFIRARHDVYAASTGPQVADWQAVSWPWLELPNSFAESELFELTYAQTGNRIRFAHRNRPVIELEREPSGKWSYRYPLETTAIDFAVTVTPTRGAQIGISSSTAGTFGQIVTNAHHGLGAGDLIYIKDASAIADGFYVVGSATSTNLIDELVSLDGSLATSITTGSPSGTIIVVESTAESLSRYIVTAVDAEGREFARSEPSESVFNLLSNPEAYNSISWTTDTEAAAYRIYKEVDGTELFGFIAETGAPPFLDRRINPDLGRLAPELDPELKTDYPGAVGFYDQRGAFGGNTTKPNGLWLSSLGLDNEMVTRRTQLDTDRIAFEIAGAEGQSIRHLVPVSELLILTSTTEWALLTQNTDALTPTSVRVRTQTTVGSSYVRPLVMNNSVLFASEGNHIHRLGYQLVENSFGGTDLSLRAEHFFADVDLVDSASSKKRLPIAWYTDSAGRLLGLTYSEEEQVAGWHRHALDNYNVVSVATAREGAEDRVYVVVERNGAHTLLRMQPLNTRSIASSAHLDLCYNRQTSTETPATLTLTGDARFGGTVTATASAGSFDFDMVGETIYDVASGFQARITSRTSKTVVVCEVTRLVDGVMPATTTEWGVSVSVQRNRGFLAANEGTVTALLQRLDGLFEVHSLTIASSGIVRLPFPCQAVHLGVPYANELRTMPVSAQMEAAGLGRVKAISHGYMRVYETQGLMVGPDLDALSEVYSPQIRDLWPNTLNSEERRELVPQTWTRDGQMSFTQTQPLPATIAGVTLDVSFGG